MEIQRIFSAIESSRREIVELERLLTAIPAIAPESGGDGEWKKAQALEAWLRGKGISDIESYPCPDQRVSAGKRPNLVATIPGRTGRRLWIMSHLDVVPPGEASLWKSDPWTVVEEDGILRGRGVEDDQQGICSSVFAALGFLQAGVQPELTLKLLFMADEEVGSACGIQHLLALPSLFRADDLILIPDGGSADSTEVEVAEKNLLWLKVITEGKQCHGSTPDEGANAFLAAADCALRLHALESSPFTARDPIFSPDRSTFSPTKKEANVPNINTIPGEDVFYMDCRVLPRYPLDRVLEEFGKVFRSIEAQYGVKVSYEVEQRVESPATPVDAPVVRSAVSAVSSVYGVSARAIGIGGGTVGAYLRKAGYPCAVWSTVRDTAHQPNETAFLDDIVGDAKVMALMAASDPGN